MDRLDDGRFFVNLQMHPESHGSWIKEADPTLERVASRTGVDEIGVVTDSQWGVPLRLYMVGRE
jgi:hypothetical protein